MACLAKEARRNEQPPLIFLRRSHGEKKMLLTAATITFFILIALFAVAAGHYMKRMELYFFGVVIMLFMGLYIITNGVAVQTGVEFNQTESPSAGNGTDIMRSEVINYDQETDQWTNGIGLLLVIIAAGLSLTYWRAGKKEKQEKLESVDFEQ